jgi:RES domain-containing protein
VLAWRLSREAHQPLDGEGARLNGGRWNSEGVSIVYTSTTLALAALEYLAHVDPEDVPDDLVGMQIQIPEGVLEQRVHTSDHPVDWNEVPEHPACVRIGDRWVASASTPILRVPSAIVPEEENVLINPNHPDSGRIAVVHIRGFGFDPRLLR